MNTGFCCRKWHRICSRENVLQLNAIKGNDQMILENIIRKAAFATIVSLAAISPVWAEEDNDLLPRDQVPGTFSASMTLATDYIFRGISQTAQDPAVQGSINYGLDTGFQGIGWYAGIWSSNIDFDNVGAGAAEIDLYTGLKGSVMGLGWDVSFLQYYYPGSQESLQYDYWEFIPKLSYDFGYFAVTGSLAYSPDFFAGTGDAIYYAADVSIPVYKSLSLIGHYGHQWVDGSRNGNSSEDYSDMKVGATAKILGFNWELSYVNTFGYTADNVDSNLDGQRVLGAVTASF